MADVFISYSREDRSRCVVIAEKLQSVGLDVWFDARLQSGTSFDAEIEEQIRAANAVLVLWSPRSVKSVWVRNEATLGQRRNVLVSAQIARCDLPIQFINTHTELLRVDELLDDDPAWLNVLRRIGVLCNSVQVADLVGREAFASARRVRRRSTMAPLIAALALLGVGGAIGIGGWVYPGVFKHGSVASAGAETASPAGAIATPVSTSAKTPLPAQGSAGPTSIKPAAYDVMSLFPDIRAPVNDARAAQMEALEVEKQAKVAAGKGEDAAAQARAGAPGTRAYDYPVGKHYEGGYGETGHNGFGVQTIRTGNLASGDYYRGGFKDNQRSGLGIYEYAPKDNQKLIRNTGHWAMGLPDGLGTTDFLNGDRIEGRELAGVHTGPSVLTYADGRRYEGMLKDNLPDGLGVLWTKDGQVLSAGIWQEGKLVEPYGIQGK